MVRITALAATIAAACLPLVSAVDITFEHAWNITTDPEGSVHLNGLSFQQDPLTTFKEHQYVSFYSTANSTYGQHYVNVGRRRIQPEIGDWEYLTLTDYLQTTLDEHNTISMGVSGDGKIHLSFDHHDVPLNYRASNEGVALDIPDKWEESLFGPVQNSLPGSTGPWTPLTYPRFELLDDGDLLFEFRIGASGGGDSWIHRYSLETGEWTNVGQYIQGDDNNAYVNGFSSEAGMLYASWTTRETPDPITNHDFYFAYSDDDGKTWKNTNGTLLEKPVVASGSDVLVYAIPQNSEIINQEAQCADSQGNFHALMRDNTTGVATFYHYKRDSGGEWTKIPIQSDGLSTPPYLSYRGDIAASKSGKEVIALIPDVPKKEIQIYVATAGAGYEDWMLLTTIPNNDGEPHIDSERLALEDVLSVFVRQGGPFPDRKIQVWDFGLSF